MKEVSGYRWENEKFVIILKTDDKYYYHIRICKVCGKDDSMYTGFSDFSFAIEVAPKMLEYDCNECAREELKKKSIKKLGMNPDEYLEFVSSLGDGTLDDDLDDIIEEF